MRCAGIGFADRELRSIQTRRASVAPLTRGRREDGSRFTHFDTAARAGVILEIRQSPPA